LSTDATYDPTATELRDYAAILDDLPFRALRQIHERLQLPPDPFLDDPHEVLTDHGYHPADAVVALASSPLPEAREAMSRILGRPITVCPPCLSRYHEEFHPHATQITPARPRHPDERRILRVSPNARLPTTPAFQRFRLLRVGMTIRSYLSRVGVDRGKRDLREWTAEGSIELEVA
jgi:hypothetical protein